MKYIRTKVGILFEVLEEKEDFFVCKSHYEKRPLLNTNNIGKWAVSNQADTIEELCDEIVVELLAEGKHYLYRNGTNVKTAKLAYSDYANNIYGAIWTDKGLIYVAKMNEKGELELLMI